MPAAVTGNVQVRVHQRLLYSFRDHISILYPKWIHKRTRRESGLSNHDTSCEQIDLDATVLPSPEKRRSRQYGFRVSEYATSQALTATTIDHTKLNAV